MVHEVWEIWLLSQVLILKGEGQVLKGFHYLDNQLDTRFGPENGYATFNTGQPIPDQVNNFLLKIELYRTFVLDVNLL